MVKTKMFDLVLFELIDNAKSLNIDDLNELIELVTKNAECQVGCYISRQWQIVLDELIVIRDNVK